MAAAAAAEKMAGMAERVAATAERVAATAKGAVKAKVEKTTAKPTAPKTPTEEGFLEMNEYGPFDTKKWEHMQVFGELALAYCLQETAGNPPLFTPAGPVELPTREQGSGKDVKGDSVMRA